MCKMGLTYASSIKERPGLSSLENRMCSGAMLVGQLSSKLKLGGRSTDESFFAESIFFLNVIFNERVDNYPICSLYFQVLVHSMKGQALKNPHCLFPIDALSTVAPSRPLSNFNTGPLLPGLGSFLRPVELPIPHQGNWTDHYTSTEASS